MNKIVNLTGSSAIQPDRLPIALRAYVPPPPAKPGAQPPRETRSRKLTPPSEWTLVFDTETTVDAAQRLRVGAYQFRKADELDESGLFYDPAIISVDDLALLRRFCGESGHVLRTVAEFIDEVLLARAYDLRASIIGFNLPFDISRLAVRHGSARGKAMRGGFTFKLSQLWWRPSIQVRHLSARAALIQFTHPPKRRDSWTAKAKNCPRQSARLIRRSKDNCGGAVQPFVLARVARRLPANHDSQGGKRWARQAAHSRLRALPAR
jgi:hypothetical protein